MSRPCSKCDGGNLRLISNLNIFEHSFSRYSLITVDRVSQNVTRTSKIQSAYCCNTLPLDNIVYAQLIHSSLDTTFALCVSANGLGGFSSRPPGFILATFCVNFLNCRRYTYHLLTPPFTPQLFSATPPSHTATG